MNWLAGGRLIRNGCATVSASEPRGSTASPDMIGLEKIGYSSTIYRDNETGKARAEETLALAIETACPGETFDLFHNGRGWVIRMFEDGDFIQTI